MNTHLHEKNNAYLLSSHFDSVAEWLDYAKDYTKTSQRGNTPFLRDSEFEGFISGATLAKRFRGNTACDKAKRAVTSALAVAPDTHVQDAPEYAMYSDMSGVFCDITAHTMGEYECMVNFDIIEQQKPTVWIACSFGAYAGAKDEQFFNRGIALIRAVKHLQASGNSVGIIGYSACTCSGEYEGIEIDYHAQTIVCKRPQDELNEMLLVNLFTNCTALRTVGFAIRQSQKGSEHGSTTTLERDSLAKTEFANERIVILEADGRMYNFRTAQQGAEYVQKQIANTKSN